MTSQHELTPSVLTRGYFTLGDAVKDGYDSSIDDYNWFAFFLAAVSFWTIISILGRTVLPKAGPLEEFKKNKTEKDYYFFASQYASLTHAFIGVFFNLYILIACAS